MTTPIIETRGLGMQYEIRSGFQKKKAFKALRGVSIKVFPKKTLGIVGESGCGKSTLAKLILQIIQPYEGDILLDGKSFRDIPKPEYRKVVQMIFQDPYRSLNPRKKAIDIVAEPLYINSSDSKSDSRDKAIEIMKKVGLRSNFAYRYPHMFSGGQRQRLGIARALIMRPKVIVCDEPVSALDVSIQAQVLNLLMDLQDEFDLTYLFISHDLSVVRHLVDDVAVMYLGKVVESGRRDQVFSDPKHPYTQALLASTPNVQALGKPIEVLKGEIPSVIHPPPGCTFHTRCPKIQDSCKVNVPELKERFDRRIACDVV